MRLSKLSVLMLTLFLGSCTSEMVEPRMEPDKTDISDGHISMQQAKQRLANIVTEINAQIPEGVNRIPVGHLTAGDFDGVALNTAMEPLTRGQETDAACYVLRMNDDMFAIMSATSDKPELLAIGSGNPNFKDSTANMPDSRLWSPLAGGTSGAIGTDSAAYGDNRGRKYVRLTPTYTIHHGGGICKVKWGNKSPYNDSLPSILDDYGNWVKPATGCLAIAAAQLMTTENLRGAYYQNHTFDWDNLAMLKYKNDVAQSPGYRVQIATLFKDLTSRENLNSNFGEWCTTSGMSSIFRTLTNFNFSNNGTHYETYDFLRVKNELDNGYPVIFAAHGADVNDIYHVWLCHGMLEVKTPVKVYSVSALADEPDILIDEYVETAWYLQMNWGWDAEADGYFLTQYDQYLDNKGGPDIPEFGTDSIAGWNTYLPRTLQTICGIRY